MVGSWASAQTSLYNKAALDMTTLVSTTTSQDAVAQW